MDGATFVPPSMNTSELLVNNILSFWKVYIISMKCADKDLRVMLSVEKMIQILVIDQIHFRFFSQLFGCTLECDFFGRIIGSDYCGSVRINQGTSHYIRRCWVECNGSLIVYLCAGIIKSINALQVIVNSIKTLSITINSAKFRDDFWKSNTLHHQTCWTINPSTLHKKSKF